MPHLMKQQRPHPHRRLRRSAGVLASAVALALGAGVVSGPTSAYPATVSRGAADTQLAAAALTPVNVPGTTPMSAMNVPNSGYSEQEFYAEGFASRYRGAQRIVSAGSAPTTAQVIDHGWPYKSRVLVRTPQKVKFNGTLVVEWANVTGGLDLDAAFAESHEYLLREGYAVAVVSAQRVGVLQLKAWSPTRYGDVTVDADNTDPLGGLIDDRNDPLSWDVYAQITRALQTSGADDALPGLTVKRTVALGESQSAGRLTAYYNNVHPLHRIFDGFVFLDRAGQLRGDQGLPAISVVSEYGASRSTAAPPTDSEHVRVWETGGASHVTLAGARYMDGMMARDQSRSVNGVPVTLTQLIAPCDLMPLWGTVDYGVVLNKAIDAVNRWVQFDRRPAPSTYLQRRADGTLARDANGKVIGGVQLPDYTAPTEYSQAVNSGPGLCALGGHHRDYTAEELRQMYGTHRNYVAEVFASLREVVGQGYVLHTDATALRLEALHSDVAR
jgi:hypothetical protein